VSNERRIDIVCGVCIACVFGCVLWAVWPASVRWAEVHLSASTEWNSHFISYDVIILILREYFDPGLTPLLSILDVPGSHLFSVIGSPKRFVIMFVGPRRQILICAAINSDRFPPHICHFMSL